MAAVRCKRHDCSKTLPPGRRAYCSDECSKTVRMRRYRKSQMVDRDEQTKALNVAKLEEAAAADGRGSMRRGPEYEKFVSAGGPSMVDGPNGLSHQEIADIFGVSRVTVTHWLAAARQDAVVEKSRMGWRPPAAALEALEDHVAFKDRYFRLPNGEPYVTAQCHREWAAGLEDAIDTGGQKAIIAPPRHGKTEEVVIECVRQIVKNPNVRIAWVGVNEDRARDAVGFAMKELEFNERLIADFCGPGGSFKPPTRSGTRWTDSEFTVATRTSPSKSATMKGFGRGGRIIGFDADVIVCDDIEDQSSVSQPAMREKTVRWFNTDVASRKMEHTAWFYIGSRQHPEDLIYKLMLNPRWDVSVYQAHDDQCTVPEEEPERHTDCVLAPELRSYKFLMEQRETMTAPIFEMNFLNRPRSDSLTRFPRDIVEDCRDRSRVLGDIPPSTRLVAGLDPSHKRYTGAILWAVHAASNTRFIVDVENRPGSGLLNMRAILELWENKYSGIEGWAIEENIASDSLAHDKEVKELIQRLGIRLIPHKTGRNKWDVRLGVPAMADHFEKKRINLPYGDAETRAKVEPVINQFVNFTPDITSHMTNIPTDLVMAAWFPEKYIQDMAREFHMGMAAEDMGGGLGGLDSLDRLLGGM